jgi:hypothetical protein
MSMLEKLTFVAEAAKPEKSSPVLAARENLLSALQLQIDSVLAMEKGESFVPKRERFVTNNGKREKVLLPLRMRHWFWRSGETGKTDRFVLEVRYGNRQVPLNAKGDKYVQVKNLKDVATAFGTIKAAIEAGELDAALTSIKAARKRKTA